MLQLNEVLQSLFFRYRIPCIIVSDNGTQFTSALLTKFCKRNGIHHELLASYHPSTNGEAECIKANENKLLLCQFLMKYLQGIVRGAWGEMWPS